MRAPVVPTFAPPPRRRSYSGLAGSALFHAALIFLLISPAFRRYHLLGANGSDLPGTGGGGAGAQYIALPALRAFAPKPPAPQVEVRVQQTPPVTPPVVPPTVIPPPTPSVDTLPSRPAAPPSDSAGGASGAAAGKQGGGTGGGTGGGQGPGTGGGAGPGTGGGERGRPPVLRNWPVPPMEGTPKPLRGVELVIRCFVGRDGRVDRFEFVPEVPSGAFRNKLADVIAGFKFTPARDSTGAVVPGIAPVTLTLSTK